MANIDGKTGKTLPESNVFWSLKTVNRVVAPIRFYGTEELEIDEGTEWKKRLKIIEYLPTRSDKPSSEYSKYIEARILARKRDEFASKWSENGIEEPQSNTNCDISQGIPFLDDQDQINCLKNLTVDDVVNRDKIQRRSSISPEVITLDDCSPTIKVSCPTSLSPSSVLACVDSRSGSTTIEPEILSPAKKVERDEVRVDDTPQATNTEISDVKNLDISSCPPKAKTPELMDEGVGGESRSFVKIPRKVISFNLHAYEAQCINVNHKNPKKSTEISAADSSVTDDANSTFHTALPHLNRKENVPFAKKLTIVEDVTCVEGTLLRKNMLFDSSRVAINQTVQPKNDVGCGIQEESEEILIAPEVPSRRKRRVRNISCCRKKSRIRRTFRQLFGNISTSSELDEEDDIVERFLGISRRKKSRNSSDSGVGLIEINSENTYVSQSDSEQRDSSEESTQSSSEEMEIDDVKMETDESKTPLRSMPLLDPLASAPNSTEEILADNLPDSSTNSSEESPAQADSSSPEASNTKKTLTILVSPLDVNSSDAFSPLTLEIDIPYENKTLVATSTTQHFSETLTISKIEGNENTKENKDSSINVDIRDEEKCKVLPLARQHSKNEAIVIDNSGIELPTEDPSGETATVALDLSNHGNKGISLCKEFENVTPVPEAETASSDQGIPKNSTERLTAERDQRDSTNEIITQPALPSSPSVPRIRVLLPSELGSRWCPTPLNMTPYSQSVPNVPSDNLSWSAAPVSQNYQPQGNGIANIQPYQGNGIPNVQPGQTFQNRPCTVSSNMAERTTGMYSTNYGNTPNAPTCSQPGCTVQNPLPPGQDERHTIIQKSIHSIFSLLSSLHTCLQENESAYEPEIAIPLHNRFKLEKGLLALELQNLAPLVGIPVYTILMERLIEIYIQDFHCTPKLNKEQILKVLWTVNLRSVPRPMPPPVNFQSQIYHSQFASQLRPPPPSYPLCSSPWWAPRNNVVPIPRYLPSRPVPPTNFDQRTYSGIAQPPAPNTPVMTPAQLNTLRNQVNAYNRMQDQNQKKPRRSKKLPTEKTTKAPKAWKSVQRVAPIPTLVDPISPRISSPVQNIQSPIPTPPCQELENIPRFANQINDPQSSANTEAEKRHWSESLEDVLEYIAAMSQTFNSNNSTPDNNNNNHNNDEQQITKMETSTCSRTPEKSINSETTHPVQEKTTYPVEKEIMCSVQEQTTNPVEEQTICSVGGSTTDPVEGPVPSTCSLEENARCTVETETTCHVEEETTCSVAQATTCPVEEETTCSVEEETTCPVKEETTCPVEEETTCSVAQATTCPVEEETTCPVEEETMYFVEEETTCPVKEETTYPVEEVKSVIGEVTTSLVEEETNNSFKEKMPLSNNTEENDDVSSRSNCQIIDVLDDSEKVEKDVTTDSNIVSVIVSNDSANENTAIPKNEDTETNFSILEVKSITKDIFDNLGISKEELSPPTSPEATTDDIENHEDSTTNSELRNCLRCGEPSSVVCEQCYEAFYCSSECHETDWTEHHYLTCKPVPAEALALFAMSWNSEMNLPSPEAKLSTK